MGGNDAAIFFSDKMRLEIHAENLAIFINMKNMLQRIVMVCLAKHMLNTIRCSIMAKTMYERCMNRNIESDCFL